jgi:hypothetical protein
MKKILLIISLILCLTGCNEETITESINGSMENLEIDIRTDNETCVEYFVFSGSYKGDIQVRLNQDGTVKIDESCLLNKEE